jgi:hypothetical protein
MPQVGVWTYELAGLVADIDSGGEQAWLIAGQAFRVVPWLDHRGYYVLLVRNGKQTPFAANALSLVEVYAAVTTGRAHNWARHRKDADAKSVRAPSPTLARFKCRQLIECGAVERPAVNLTPLRSDARPQAAALWPVIASLLEARALVEDFDPVPLVAPFLALWGHREGVTESSAILGKQWLKDHRYIVHVGDEPSGKGKPTQLWHVAGFHFPEPYVSDEFLRELIETFDAVEVTE